MRRERTGIIASCNQFNLRIELSLYIRLPRRRTNEDGCSYYIKAPSKTSRLRVGSAIFTVVQFICRKIPFYKILSRSYYIQSSFHYHV